MIFVNRKQQLLCDAPDIGEFEIIKIKLSVITKMVYYKHFITMLLSFTSQERSSPSYYALVEVALLSNWSRVKNMINSLYFKILMTYFTHNNWGGRGGRVYQLDKDFICTWGSGLAILTYLLNFICNYCEM